MVDTATREVALPVESCRCTFCHAIRYFASMLSTLLGDNHASCVVHVEDLLRRPVFEVQRIASFIGIKVREEDILPLLQKYSLGLTSHPNDIPLSNWQQLAVDTIKNELDTSKNLSRWPCRSFKELESKEVLLPHRRYYMLAVNCSRSFTKCSVQYDLREQREIQ